MTRLSSSVDIDAPPAQVWEVLADLGGIYKWNPGVKNSYATSEAGRGEGATRHCDLRPAGRLEERAFDWREGEGYKIDVYDSNLPLDHNIVEFTLQPQGEHRTRVTLRSEYQLKFGPVGALLDALFGPTSSAEASTTCSPASSTTSKRASLSTTKCR